MAESVVAPMIRLYVGGLPADVTIIELRERFAPYGKVAGVEMIKDAAGTWRGFCYVNLKSDANKIQKCMTTYNGTVWRGGKMRILPAKPTFMQRLEKEWTEGDEEPPVEQENNEPKEYTGKDKSKRPPLPLEWKTMSSVDKRAAPVLRITKKHRKKIFLYDPSVYKRNLHLTDLPEPMLPVSQLAWTTDEDDESLGALAMRAHLRRAPSSRGASAATASEYDAGMEYANDAPIEYVPAEGPIDEEAWTVERAKEKRSMLDIFDEMLAAGTLTTTSTADEDEEAPRPETVVVKAPAAVVKPVSQSAVAAAPAIKATAAQPAKPATTALGRTATTVQADKPGAKGAPSVPQLTAADLSDDSEEKPTARPVAARKKNAKPSAKKQRAPAIEESKVEEPPALQDEDHSERRPEEAKADEARSGATAPKATPGAKPDGRASRAHPAQDEMSEESDEAPVAAPRAAAPPAKQPVTFGQLVIPKSSFSVAKTRAPETVEEAPAAKPTPSAKPATKKPAAKSAPAQEDAPPAKPMASTSVKTPADAKSASKSNLRSAAVTPGASDRRVTFSPDVPVPPSPPHPARDLDELAPGDDLPRPAPTPGSAAAKAQRLIDEMMRDMGIASTPVTAPVALAHDKDDVRSPLPPQPTRAKSGKQGVKAPEDASVTPASRKRARDTESGEEAPAAKRAKPEVASVKPAKSSVVAERAAPAEKPGKKEKSLEKSLASSARDVRVDEATAAARAERLIAEMTGAAPPPKRGEGDEEGGARGKKRKVAAVEEAPASVEPEESIIKVVKTRAVVGANDKKAPAAIATETSAEPPTKKFAVTSSWMDFAAPAVSFDLLGSLTGRTDSAAQQAPAPAPFTFQTVATKAAAAPVVSAPASVAGAAPSVQLPSYSKEMSIREMARLSTQMTNAPRLFSQPAAADAGAKFMRKGTFEDVQEEWETLRPQLTQDYKRKRSEARRKNARQGKKNTG